MTTQTSAAAPTSSEPAFSISSESADPNGLPRLRDTAFPLLWLNGFSYVLISFAERFTFVWLVIETLNGPSWASGTVLFCLGVPVFFLVLPAGALADRYDRRKLLMSTQLAGALITFASAMLIRTNLMTVRVALVPALLLGASMAFGQPIRSSLIPAVVPKSLLMRAIVANTVGMNIGMIIGPVIGGLAIRRWGVEAAFMIEAALFMVGFIALLPVRLPPKVDSGVPDSLTARGLVASIREGLSFVWAEPVLRGLFFLLSVGGFLMMGSATLLLPQIARNAFGRDAAESSRLFAFAGLGMMVSSLVLMAKKDVSRKGLAFMLAMVSGTTSQTVLGFAPSYAVLCGLMVWWGLSGGWYMNLNQTLIQTSTPAEKMGRVMSLSVLVSTGFAPLGSLIAGTLAGTRLGPQHTLAIFGALGLACVLMTIRRSAALRNRR